LRIACVGQRFSGRQGVAKSEGSGLGRRFSQNYRFEMVDLQANIGLNEAVVLLGGSFREVTYGERIRYCTNVDGRRKLPSGYGIAGAALAKFLDGHAVCVFEQAMERKPISARVLLQPSG